MRCKICDSMLNNPNWNGKINDWEVCSVCLEIIFSTFEDFEPEDDVVEEDDEDIEKIILDALEIIQLEEALAESA